MPTKLDEVQRQRAIENRIATTLDVLGYVSPIAGETKLIDAMEMIASALEDILSRGLKEANKKRYATDRNA